MKPTRILHYLPLLFLLSAALSACSGDLFSSTSWPGMTTHQDTVYLAYNQYIHALNLETGVVKWRYPTEKPDNRVTFFAAPVVTSKNQLLVASYDHNLYSFDPQNGQVLWTFEESKDRLIASPLATEKAIYVPSSDGNLYAIDFTGSLLWVFDTEHPLWAQPASDGACECIYLPSMDHKVYAIHADTGSLIWKTELLNGAIVGTPAVDEQGAIYVGTFAKEMVAINVRNGDVKWRVPTGGWVWSGPALNANKLYFGDLGGNFYCLDTSTGAIQWTFEANGAITGTPLIKEGKIYFATEQDTLYVLKIDGSLDWSQTISGKMYSPLISAGELILVTPTGSDLLATALTSSGAQKWLYVPEK